MKVFKKYSRMITFYHNVGENTPLSFIEELLRIEKKYNIQATYNIAPELYKKRAQLVKKLSETGHEISLYLDNPVPIPDLQKTLNSIKMEGKISSIPVGYHSDDSEFDSDLFEALWRSEFLWNAEIDEKAEPYFIYKGLVRLPIAFDNRLVQTNEIDLEMWEQKFLFFLENRKYFGYGLLNHNFNFREYLEAYERILELAVRQNVFIVTFSQVADLFRRANLVRYYSETAKDWNKQTRVLYRTKRFQELIRNEVEKLKSPIVADLGSGGGVLSSFLADFSAKIYCIDNAEGMVGDIQTDSAVQSILGEVTATTLPDNSIDFIICARVIEYMYYPELVANEIKRIGKLNAKFIVTFPAHFNNGPTNIGNNVSDRIRKYFLRKEVLTWANQIGSGRLIGIQYKQAEPQNINEEKSYRQFEEEQPPTQVPTNWVFIGTIENKKSKRTNFKSIPLNMFRFNLG